MFMIKNPLLITITATLFLAGCGADKTAEAPQSVVNDSAVAIVNGAAITQKDLDAVKAQMPIHGSDEDIVNQLVELKLLAQKAESDGLAKDPMIQAELERARESILANHLVKQHLQNKTFSDEELKAEYDQMIAKMPKRHEFKAAHILVEDEALAKDLIAKIKDGADFAALAKEHSTDPGSKDKGGELGWFEASMMVPEFASAVASLEPGKLTTEPVKTQFGWHIIKLEDKRLVPPPSFDSVKPQLSNILRQKAISQFIDETRKQAKVEIKLPKAEGTTANEKPAESEGE